MVVDWENDDYSDWNWQGERTDSEDTILCSVYFKWMVGTPRNPLYSIATVVNNNVLYIWKSLSAFSAFSPQKKKWVCEVMHMLIYLI